MNYKPLLKRCLFSLGLFAIYMGGHANPGIALTLLDYRVDSSQVGIGFTLTISAQVQNTDSSNIFAGLLDFGVRNTNNDLTNTGLFKKPPYSGAQIVLNPNEIVPAVFSIKIDDGFFAPGPDVVVVWPISSQSIDDSIVIHLQIENPLAVVKHEELDLHYLITPGKIYLQYQTDKINLQQVRIYNIFGQVSAVTEGNFISEIPLPYLSRGIYLCELISSENKRRVIKFFH